MSYVLIPKMSLVRLKIDSGRVYKDIQSEVLNGEYY